MNNLLRIIHELGKHGQMTVRQLSIASSIPYTTVHRIAKSPLFIKERIGPSTVCRLTDDPIGKHYLIIAERAVADDFVKRYHMFRVLRENLPEGDYCVILFGSRAVEKHREKSDIDLCVINNEALRFTKIEILYGVPVNPLRLDEAEFQEMLIDKEHNVAKEIMRKHIVLRGEELFWNLIRSQPRAS
jgi:predicted nucleotidyltransferase